MKFSDRFNKALDSIRSIVPDNEADYERVLDTTPRPMPYRNGQPVTVFNDSAHGVFVCYGIVLGSEWNPLTGYYDYEIQVRQSKQTMTVYGFHIEPASPEVMRMLFMQIDNPARKS